MHPSQIPTTSWLIDASSHCLPIELLLTPTGRQCMNCESIKSNPAQQIRGREVEAESYAHALISSNHHTEDVYCTLRNTLSCDSHALSASRKRNSNLGLAGVAGLQNWPNDDCCCHGHCKLKLSYHSRAICVLIGLLHLASLHTAQSAHKGLRTICL